MNWAVLSVVVQISVIIPTCFAREEIYLGRFDMTSNPSDPAYNDYLKAMGYPDEFRSFVVKSPHSIEITKNGKTITVKGTVGQQSLSRSFLSGEVLEETLVDGRKCKAIHKVADNKISRELTCGDLISKENSEFSKEGVVIMRTVKDKIVFQNFKRA